MEYKGLTHCECCIQIPEMTPVALVYWSNPEVCAGNWHCPMCGHVSAMYYCPYIPKEALSNSKIRIMNVEGIKEITVHEMMNEVSLNN